MKKYHASNTDDSCSWRGYKISSKIFCHSGCELFRCGTRALKVVGGKRMCSLTMDVCEPRSCAYTVCVAKKLLPNGVCGRTVRRKTRPLSIEEGLKLEKDVIKGKLRNLEDDIF